MYEEKDRTDRENQIETWSRHGPAHLNSVLEEIEKRKSNEDNIGDDNDNDDNNTDDNMELVLAKAPKFEYDTRCSCWACMILRELKDSDEDSKREKFVAKFREKCNCGSCIALRMSKDLNADVQSQCEFIKAESNLFEMVAQVNERKYGLYE